MPTWSIRCETPDDGPALHALLVRAFRRAAEAHVVALHRAHDPAYDPSLSLVAIADSDCIGHVLLTPATIRLGGEDVAACMVGPLAVTPAWQRRGVGASLIEAGHAAARAHGARVAFLLGHPGYYPRFGYQPRFGFSQTQLDPDRLPPPQQPLVCRPVRADDGPWLATHHRREWQAVDFGWMRSPDCGAWDIPGAEAVLWETVDGQRAAYTHVSADQDRRALVVAEDPLLAREAILTLRPRRLDHHPQGWLARAVLAPLGIQARVAPASPNMACALVPDAFAALTADRPVGGTTFPITFTSC